METEINTLRSSRDIKQNELDSMSDSDRYSWQIAGTNADGSAAYEKSESPAYVGLRSELADLNSQINDKENLLYDLRLNNNVESDVVLISEDTYKYIADKLKVNNEFLMFFLRALLSVVFAMMAPYGFNRLLSIWNPKQQRTKMRDIIDKMLTIKYDKIMESLEEKPQKKKTENTGEFDYLKKKTNNTYISGEVRHAEQKN